MGTLRDIGYTDVKMKAIWAKNITVIKSQITMTSQTSITAIGITVVLILKLKKAIQTALAMATILMDHGICLRTKSQISNTHVELKILHQQNPY